MYFFLDAQLPICLKMLYFDNDLSMLHGVMGRLKTRVNLTRIFQRAILSTVSSSLNLWATVSVFACYAQQTFQDPSYHFLLNRILVGLGTCLLGMVIESIHFLPRRMMGEAVLVVQRCFDSLPHSTRAAFTKALRFTCCLQLFNHSIALVVA